MGHPRFLKFTDKAGQARFNLSATNGQIILASEGYTSTAGRDNGIASVQKNGGDASRYTKSVSRDGQYFFNLKAGNGEIIGRSEMYTTEAARDNGIASVMKNSQVAGIEEG